MTLNPLKLKHFCAVPLLGITWSLALPAHAGWPCSISHAYPEVSQVAVRDGHIVVLLGEYFNSEEEQEVTLRRAADNVWVREPVEMPTTVPVAGSNCGADFAPPIDTPWLEMWTDFSRYPDGYEQGIGACTTDDDAIWAGTSFYGAEGSWGIGALIRKDLQTGKYRYVHDLHLQPYSTSHLQHYASTLWIGTTHHGECGGPAYGYGVMSYDIRREVGVKPVPEVCGFSVRGMLEHDEKLWVATDLGLAVGNTTPDGGVAWQNYVPDLGDESLMRPVQCYDLYEELLRSPRLATDTAFDMGYAFEDFWRRLSNLRREFVRDYLRKLHGHPTWHYPDE